MCSFKVILEGTDKSLRFAGSQLKKYDDFQPNDVWVEIPCNRTDEHPLIGHHSFTKDGITVSWDIKDTDVWIAN